jgi:hypothetical protein
MAARARLPDVDEEPRPEITLAPLPVFELIATSRSTPAKWMRGDE